MFLIDFLVSYPLQRLVQSSALQKDNSLYMYISVVVLVVGVDIWSL